VYFIVFATDKPGSADLRAATRPEHRQYLHGGHEGIRLHHAGPTLSDDGRSMNGTLLVVEADDIARVRRFVAEDPYSRAGLFAEVTIRPWNWVTGAPQAAPAPAPGGAAREASARTALAIIHQEHRALAAVLHGLKHLARELRAERLRPDFTLLAAILDYLDAFPEKFHHPKEDAYLYRLMRLRSAEAAPLLDALEREHRQGTELMRELRHKLIRYRELGAPAADAFLAAVDAFADFNWAHMRREEEEALPAAERVLNAQDWTEIATAFTDHKDPLLGIESEREFRKLFSRIVALAQPPIGVGAAGAEP
jgi:uncharacterized protein YciI/hemerythrin-like domain-containing protein